MSSMFVLMLMGIQFGCVAPCIFSLASINVDDRWRWSESSLACPGCPWQRRCPWDCPRCSGTARGHRWSRRRPLSAPPSCRTASRSRAGCQLAHRDDGVVNFVSLLLKVFAEVFPCRFFIFQQPKIIFRSPTSSFFSPFLPIIRW